MSRNSAAPVESPIRPVTAEGTGGGLPVPLEPYRSPEFFAAERERLFGRAWLLMGRIEELPTPRSHVVKRVDIRSEEHTSELQSLMRISYAVFCLKKKKNAKRPLVQLEYSIQNANFGQQILIERL